MEIQNETFDGRPICLIMGPVAARAGYGNMARDISTMMINSGKYNVRIVSLPWGNCPLDVLNASNTTHKNILDRLITQHQNQLTQQPDISICVSIPTEFKRIGKFSIGYTAGIETNTMAPQWLQSCNEMDLVLTISEHSKKVAVETAYEMKDQAGNVTGNLKLTKPIEVVHCTIDKNINEKLQENNIITSVRHFMKNVDEKFNFLFVGHWLNGNLGEDRKNVGLLVKLFLETFKDRKNKPGLILKTSGAGFSILDRETILTKINEIKKSVDSTDLPSVYLLHGDLTDLEMNSLYNHPKIKAHISLTKGEGFGIPLLEATISQKPVIASSWSGHLDFLTPSEAILLKGELKPIHDSAVWEGVLNKGSLWFSPVPQFTCNAMNEIFLNYDKHKQGAMRLGIRNREKFSMTKIQEQCNQIFDKYVPKFATVAPIKLPTLRKL